MSDLLSGVIGGLVVAVTGAIAYFYKRRVDTVSTLRITLFRLLELQRSVRLVSMPGLDKQLDWYCEVADELFPEQKILENKEEAKKLALSFFSEAVMPLVPGDDDNLYSIYLDAISKLGPIAPILAYRLGTNVMLKKALVEMDNYHEKAKKHLENDASESDLEILKVACETVRNRVTSEAIDTLGDDVMWVALRCGLFTFIVLFYQRYIRRSESFETILKKEYRAMLLDVNSRTKG